MLETGGMEFIDQFSKTFFGNVFNNEMHKIFIGSFIPTIYIAYFIMCHGVINQFETLRSKNGMTATAIKITGNFTTVNFTTNDVMDWEFIITSSFTKIVVKMCLSGHYKKRSMFSLWYCWPQGK